MILPTVEALGRADVAMTLGPTGSAATFAQLTTGSVSFRITGLVRLARPNALYGTTAVTPDGVRRRAIGRTR